MNGALKILLFHSSDYSSFSDTNTFVYTGRFQRTELKGPWDAGLQTSRAEATHFCDVTAILHVAPLTASVASRVIEQPAAVFSRALS